MFGRRKAIIRPWSGLIPGLCAYTFDEVVYVRRRGSFLEGLWNLVQRGERRLIRVMVLAAVILALVQMTQIKDPLDFYIEVAGKVEDSPLEVPAFAHQAQVYQTSGLLTLKATPVAPIRVMQNGQVIGTLANGEKQLTVEAGEIQLDGRGLNQPIQVQVIHKDAHFVEPRLNQVVVTQGNVQKMTVKFAD